jgi:polyhydroxyalkanoate synthesis regulator phasin
LLAAKRGPLVLSCLQTLFEQSQNGIPFEETLQSLADLLTQHANQTDFEIGAEDRLVQARKELRDWIKRGLVVEREGRLYATDALEEALRFVDALDNRVMTSTASRLSVVQREIEGVEASLNPDPKSRTGHLRRQIQDLERQLAEVEAGRVEVLSEREGVERILDIFNLAMSLRADFRRVEDSWRDTDRALRHSIVSEQNHRGEIVDKLLDSHDTLLETPEGRVFHGFQQQLSRAIELEHMKGRLRAIVKHPFALAALNQQQHTELRWLVMRLVKESETVIQARARIERDVKGFLKTGLAAEHHRVGLLLNEILREALNIDWASAAIRRRDGPLPPVAFSNSSLPLAERLRFKSLDDGQADDLELSRKIADLNQVDDDFWRSFAALDRQALVRETLALLKRSGRALSIAELASFLPPTHDLESLTVWLTMAREAGVVFREAVEGVEVVCSEGPRLRFQVPFVELSAEVMPDLEWEI